MRSPLAVILILIAAAIVVWLFVAAWPDWLTGVIGAKKLLVTTIFNGVTLAGLYFLVASGFTLVFGLMRNVNLAHGSLYLFGAYVGFTVAELTGYWLIGVAAGFLAGAIAGALMQVLVFRRMEGEELRQTLVTIGISIVAADLMLAGWSGKTYQFTTPDWLDGAVTTPIVLAVRSNGAPVPMTYPFYRLVVLAAAIVIGIGLWLVLNRTRIGMMIRAGVDDRAMLAAAGVNVHVVFAIVFAIGAGLAGFAGVVGGTALSIAPGEDVRYLLASLVVVIVGGMGSISGAAIGALLIGLAEQIGLAYFPTYGVVLTFIIMVAVLAFRPQGIMGGRREGGMSIASATGDAPGAAPAAIGSPLTVIAAVLLVAYPLVATPFFIYQVGAYALILGVITLSLTFLAGYGGMVSLAQMSAAGFAGYVVAILGHNSRGVGFDWPWWLLVPTATFLGALFSVVAGLLAARTAGIYTIMITLAIGMAFFLLTQQNYAVFNGHSGFAGIAPPTVLALDWRDPVPFYYLALVVAVACYAGVLYISRSPFGLALQAIRDNPRRMRALGFHVAAHRVAAYGLAGIIAGLGGVLLVWFNGRISPGTIGVDRLIDVLVIAIVGGTRHPAGAFLGAIFFVLLDTFAIDLVGAERFNTLIGILFLAIVLFSPDGILGLFEKARRSLSMKGNGG